MKLSSTFVILGMLQAVLAQGLEPSPTESVGCEPHGDHWHCEGPRPTDDTSPSDETAPADETAPVDEPSPTEEEHEDHDHASESEDPGPSPTESEGCEPHGDHWHCEGPEAEESEAAEAAAGSIQMSVGAVVAAAAFALA